MNVLSYLSLTLHATMDTLQVDLGYQPLRLIAHKLVSLLFVFNSAKVIVLLPEWLLLDQKGVSRPRLLSVEWNLKIRVITDRCSKCIELFRALDCILAMLKAM